MENTAPPVAINESAFPYKTASYAVIAPSAFIALNFLTIAFRGVLAGAEARIVFGIIAQLGVLLLLSAIPAGIIALCGIPKYGKKKLLWKGLFGILFSILLLGLVTWGFFMAKRLSEERARQQQTGH